MSLEWVPGLVPRHFQAYLDGHIIEIHGSDDGRKWFGKVEGHKMGRRPYRSEASAKKWTEKNARKLISKRLTKRLERELMLAGGAVI